MKPTMSRLDVGQSVIFPIAKWESIRVMASQIKKTDGKILTVNRRPNTIVVTRIK